MQAAHGAPGRGLLSSHRHDLGPAFTVSFSGFPALNVGDVDADIATASPVLGLRPVRAGRLLAPKVPTPAAGPSRHRQELRRSSRTHRPLRPLQRPCSAPCGQPNGSAISVLFISSLPAVMLCRSAIPRWHIARFQTPTTTNSRLPRRPATPRRIRSVVADPPVSPHRSRSCISGPIRKGRARCAPPCARTPTVR